MSTSKVISKKQVYFIGLITLFGFGIIGAIIIEKTIDKSFLSIFEHGKVWYLQLLIGSLYGLATGWIAWMIIKSRLLKPVRNYYVELIQGLHLNKYEIVFLSFCAGVGEELFFRGAIQNLLGIWITSILFILLHGYINPLNWRLSIYGIVMVFFIAGLGYLYEYVGILSAMAAHFVIDVMLLSALTLYKQDNI